MLRSKKVVISFMLALLLVGSAAACYYLWDDFLRKAPTRAKSVLTDHSFRQENFFHVIITERVSI